MTIRNTGRGTAQVTLLDAPPLPVIPNTAWGGLIWDAGAGALRWHGYLGGETTPLATA